jgi:SAM-dependent methyltransferase
VTVPGGWLGAMWPFVRDHLPAPPATVLEIGCGAAGGFVPALRDAGYDVAGVDPQAPAAPGFHQIAFERYEPEQPVAAVVASNSLHHVGDLAEVAGRIGEVLRPDGILIVMEWGWERFDAATARWCFDRLAGAGDDDHDWLRRRHDDWVASGRPWDDYFPAWAAGHGLHAGSAVVAALDARFHRGLYADGPYFFPALAGVTYADEQAAIDDGQIQPGGIRYVGTPPPPSEPRA